MEGVLQLWRRYESNRRRRKQQGEIIQGSNIIFLGCVCVCVCVCVYYKDIQT